MLVTNVFCPVKDRNYDFHQIYPALSDNAFNLILSKILLFGKKLISTAGCDILDLVYYLFTTQSRLFTTLTKRSFENVMGIGENAGNQHFSTLPKTNSNFTVTFILSSASAFNLYLSKNLLFGRVNDPEEEASENIMGKPDTLHFVFSPQCF